MRTKEGGERVGGDKVGRLILRRASKKILAFRVPGDGNRERGKTPPMLGTYHRHPLWARVPVALSPFWPALSSTSFRSAPAHKQLWVDTPAAIVQKETLKGKESPSFYPTKLSYVHSSYYSFSIRRSEFSFFIFWSHFFLFLVLRDLLYCAGIILTYLYCALILLSGEKERLVQVARGYSLPHLLATSFVLVHFVNELKAIFYEHNRKPREIEINYVQIIDYK